MKATGRKIWVVETFADNIGHLVLNVQNTATMYALTSSHIYCMYPELQDENENINFAHSETRWWNPSQPEYVFGMRTHLTTQFWNKPCGRLCPVYWRTGNIEGAEVHLWNIGEEVKAVTLDLRKFTWRLPRGTSCRNERCPNYGRLRAMVDISHH